MTVFFIYVACGDGTEIIMKCYDARMIEGCCVFSYEVKTPDHSEKKQAKKRKSASLTWKKIMLHFLFFMLYPFAFLVDSTVMIVQKVYRKCRSFFCGYVSVYVLGTCILSSVSATAMIPLLIHLF